MQNPAFTPVFGPAPAAAPAAPLTPTTLSPAATAALENLHQRLASHQDSPSAPDCLAHRAKVVPGVATRGARVPQIRSVVADWARGPAGLLVRGDARALAQSLVVDGQYLDDVLAGVCWIGEWLIGRDGGVYGVSDLAVFGGWFASASLGNFMSVDEFGTKVVGKMVEVFGGFVVEKLKAWCTDGGEGSSWRARAALIGMMGVAKEQWARVVIREGCVALASGEVMDAKSALGTILRAVGKGSPGVVDENGQSFVREVLSIDVVLLGLGGVRGVLGRALEGFDAEEKKQWRARYRGLARDLQA